MFAKVRGLLTGSLALLFVFVLSAYALADGSGVTLADPGFQVSDYFTAVATTLGGIVAAALGVTLAFWAIRRGLRWLRG